MALRTAIRPRHRHSYRIRRGAGQRAGDCDHRPPHHGAARHGRRTGGNYQCRRHHGRYRGGARARRARRDTRTQAVPALAGAHPPALSPARRCGGALAHRTAHPRYLLPAGEGRAGRRARPVRRGQDHAAAADRALGRRRHRDLCRLRRARQRAGGHPRKLPQAHRPQHRALADGAHAAGRQHLQHAGGRARSVDLRRRHPGRILPRPGLRRGDGGRLHQPLGGGAARSGGTAGPDAGGGRLSRLSRLAPRRVLRARRTGDHTVRRQRLDHPDRRGIAARRRLLRTGHQPHQGDRADLLGAVQGTRRRAPLSRGGLGGEFLRLYRQLQRLVGRACRSALGGAARRGAGAPVAGRGTGAHRQPGRPRSAVAAAALGIARRGAVARGRAATECARSGGQLLLAAKAVRPARADAEHLPARSETARFRRAGAGTAAPAAARRGAAPEEPLYERPAG